MSHRVMLVLAVVALAGCEQPAAPTAAQRSAAGTARLTKAGTTRSNDFLPVSGTLVNECTGEVVALSGRQHIVQTMTPTADGGAKLSIHVNFDDLQGVSDAGVVYHANAAAHAFEYDTSTPGVFSTDEVLNEVLISVGSGDNYLIHITETFGFDGTTFSESFSRMRMDCRG